MHVIKLVYICHGWMLGLFGEALSDEPAEAWRYGPVIPSVYHKYKSFRGHPIVVHMTNKSNEFTPTQNNLIEQVIEAYRNFDPWQLSGITHREGTPSQLTYEDGRGLEAIIPDEDIEEYYQSLAKA